MTPRNRVICLIGIVQLAVFLGWMLANAMTPDAPPGLASHYTVTLVLGHAVFSWIAIPFMDRASWYGLLETSGVLLVLPSPVYTLLFLMGGLTGMNFLAVHLMVALVLATGLSASATIGRLDDFPRFRHVSFGLAQFLPAIWFFASRETWLTWLEIL